MKKLSALVLTLSMFLTGCASVAPVDVDTSVATIPVEIITTSSSSIANEIKVSGKVSSNRDVAVIPAMPGEVTSINVANGDEVSEGDLLFVVDDTASASVRDQYALNLETYENTKELLSKQIEIAEESYENNKKVLDESLATAKQTHENTLELFEIGAASQMQVDQAYLGLLNQEATYATTIANLELQVLSAKSTYDTQIGQLENGLTTLRDQLDDINESTNLTAPISGIITSVNVTLNAFASNSSPAMVVSDLSSHKVNVAVSESAINFISIGNTAIISIPSLSLEDIEAEIVSVSPNANPQTGMYSVELLLPEGVYTLGAFADVTLETESEENSINIPTNTILTDTEGQYVFIIENDLAKKVSVKTGLANGDFTQVTEGLSGGEKLVTVGAEYITDGAAVSIVGGE